VAKNPEMLGTYSTVC